MNTILLKNLTTQVIKCRYIIQLNTLGLVIYAMIVIEQY